MRCRASAQFRSCPRNCRRKAWRPATTGGYTLGRRRERKIREPGDLPSRCFARVAGRGALAARRPARRPGPWHARAVPIGLRTRGCSLVPDGIGVPQLHVCVSCWRNGAERVEGARCDGRHLFDDVRALLDHLDGPPPVELLPVLCFANCERGCTAGISAAGKWSYLMGELGPEHAGDLLTYANAYAASKSGVVLPSGRPQSMQKTVIARFPAQAIPTQAIPTKDAAE